MASFQTFVIDFMVLRKSDAPESNQLVNNVLKNVFVPNTTPLESWIIEYSPQTQQFEDILSVSKCGSSNRYLHT